MKRIYCSLPPLLFTLYISILFIRLHDLDFVCDVDQIFAGSFGYYADDVALVSPHYMSWIKLLKSEIFADKIGVLFIH